MVRVVFVGVGEVDTMGVAAMTSVVGVVDYVLVLVAVGLLEFASVVELPSAQWHWLTIRD